MPDIGRKVEYLLNTGNLVSKSGLDLSQVSGFTVVAEKLNFFRYISHFRCVFCVLVGVWGLVGRGLHERNAGKGSRKSCVCGRRHGVRWTLQAYTVRTYDLHTC
jgi:hypothetical protein